MTPEEQAQRAAAIDLQLAKDAKALMDGIPDRDPETDWKRGISRHPWALIALCSLMLPLLGVLYGRNTGLDEREHALFRKGLEDQRAWMHATDRRVDGLERSMAYYGDDVGRALKIMEEMRRDQLNTLRSAADARGDDRAVANIDKKLRALADGKAGGQ